ncbi:hypothetical protein K523DRAFT_352860 [Schizophyllum commune Tattone D]|nr:hypothetical protein K523DRAFT_352860 [Schizophyllum commune Tattone D]
MKSAAIYAPLAAAALAQAFTINTPASVTQCQPTLISWDASDSQAPYYLSILPGDNPSGQPLKQFDISDGSSYSWNTDIAGGTSIGLTLKDSTGKTVQSAPVTIQNSSDDSCLNGSSSSGSASSAASTTASSTSASSAGSSSASSAASTTASSSAASTTATSAATSSRATTSSGTSSRASTSTSSSASASASSSDDENGALVNGASLGVAGAVAALVAFLA